MFGNTHGHQMGGSGAPNSTSDGTAAHTRAQALTTGVMYDDAGAWVMLTQEMKQAKGKVYEMAEEPSW